MTTPLNGFRALELPGEAAAVCGSLLADLGMDVIKIEPPGGDPSRNTGPFYRDEPSPQNSLHFWAYNLNKRGVTLDIATADGQAVFRKLARTAHFVIEGYAPGYLDSLGLGFDDLKKIDPRIVLTSITPFGQSGPYRDFRTSDIVNMAMGGLMYVTGTPDRPPLRISVPQSYTIAGMSAAMATMVAHLHRQNTGDGQHVDTSVQAAVTSVLCNFVTIWEMNRINVRRAGSFLTGRASGTKQRTLWRCKDGYIILIIFGGAIGRKTNQGLVEWMDSEGKAPEYLKKINWGKLDFSAVTQDIQDSLEKPIAEFLLTHTKSEISAESFKRGIMAMPVSSPPDIVANEQLQERGFWLDVEHPEKGATVKYPGFFVQASETPCQLRYRPPLVGEHNREIYSELGMTANELVRLKEAGVI